MARPWMLLVSLLVATHACFDPRYPEGIPCSEAMTCPPGQTCDPAALVCRTGATTPAPADAAPAVPPDASPAPAIDAAPPADAAAGPCASNPCGEQRTCTESSGDPSGYTCVCESGYVDDSEACRRPRTCLELLEHEPASANGLYLLDPDLDGAGQPFETFCEMSTDGGGWTLVQRTVWDFAETGLLHTDYATFRDALIGSAAPGAAFRVPAGRWPALQQTREHLMREVPRRASDGGDCGALYYKAVNGTWTVPPDGGATLAGAEDPNLLFNGTDAVSTLDDGPSGSLCVNKDIAVPWLYTSCCSTCPSFQGTYWVDGSHPMSNRMATTDLSGETMYTRCAPDQPRRSDSNSIYYGVNIMEYYLR